MSLPAVLFYVLAGLTGVCAVAVVVTQNIVRAAAWLLFALAGAAGVFFLLGADFVGSTQLLVYVGGTLVLVVFGVMLTAQGPFINMRIGAAEWAIALGVGLLLYGVLAVSLWPVEPPPGGPTPGLPPSVVLGTALLGWPDATPAADVTGTPAGASPLTRQKVAYLLPFEIVSVHLLVVLIGAAYLARAKRRRPAGPTDGGVGLPSLPPVGRRSPVAPLGSPSGNGGGATSVGGNGQGAERQGAPGPGATP